MLSRQARDLGLLTTESGNVIVAVAILSIVFNPILFRAIMALWIFCTRAGRWHADARALPTRSAKPPPAAHAAMLL
jgi:predicted Kef-type K+ transport protein